MANRGLYLHEIIDIIGTGSEPYKAHTGARGMGRADGGAPLVGTWQQCGSTGAWPVVVNLWEMAGWDAWAEALERQYTRTAEQTPELAAWWAEAARHRRGGFDRILVPAAWSPTRQELIDDGVRGAACLQEIAVVRPGREQRYLDAVRRHWMPAATRRGLRLVGAFATAMREGETVLLWCAPTFATVTRHLSSMGRDGESRQWLSRARAWRLAWQETLLVASPWCVTHPGFARAGG
jgi:hypothetical protein